MTTETILTDECMHEMWDTIHASFGRELFRCSHHDFARAIEQAVLQSHEVQALRKGAAMLDWLDAANAPFLTGWRTSVTSFGNVTLHTVSQPCGEMSTIRTAIRAAMEKKNEIKS